MNESAGDGCALCARERPGYQPLGGWVYRDAWWSVAVIGQVEVPGWFIVQSRTHVEALWEVDPAGTDSLGPLLAATSQALHSLLGVKRVYLNAFGERIQHWHMLVAAVPATVEPELRGPALLIDHRHLEDVDGAARVAGEVRDRLATHGSD
jgi:diadenosine tetraphosphate (Ap4A) HIT family hydrolase